MKGLLLKEIYQLKHSIKSQGFTLVLFAGIGILMKSTVYVGMMVTVLTTNMILLTMGYDENASWKRYAMTMPLQRRDLITVKYLLLYGLTLFSMLFTILISLPINAYTKIPMVESTATAMACSLISLWSVSLNILLCTKFGVEKARFLTVLSYVVPFAIIWGLFLLEEKGKFAITDASLWPLLAGGFVVSLAFSLLLWHLSCRVIEKQDL